MLDLIVVVDRGQEAIERVVRERLGGRPEHPAPPRHRLRRQAVPGVVRVRHDRPGLVGRRRDVAVRVEGVRRRERVGVGDRRHLVAGVHPVRRAARVVVGQRRQASRRVVGERLFDHRGERVDRAADRERPLALDEPAREIVDVPGRVALGVHHEPEVPPAVVGVVRHEDVRRVRAVDLAALGHTVQRIVDELGRERLGSAPGREIGAPMRICDVTRRERPASRSDPVVADAGPVRDRGARARTLDVETTSPTPTGLAQAQSVGKKSPDTVARGATPSWRTRVPYDTGALARGRWTWRRRVRHRRGWLRPSQLRKSLLTR